MDQNRRTSIPSWSVFCSGPTPVCARLLEEPSLPLKEIAAEEGISSSYVTRLLRLAFLAPDIVTAILNGRHSPQLTANRLMDDTRLPLDWTAQRKLFWS